MMSLKISSPYTFAVVESGERFPGIVVESGDSSSELLGHYSLRQIGLYPDGPIRTGGFLSEVVFSDDDLSKSTWIVDAWISSAGEGKRDTNLALVVRGLPHPRDIGRAGESFLVAFQRELSVLGDALSSKDEEGLYYHAGLITAMLSELDKAWSSYEKRRKSMRSFFSVYMAAIGIVTAIGVIVLALQYIVFSR